MGCCDRDKKVMPRCINWNVVEKIEQLVTCNFHGYPVKSLEEEVLQTWWYRY